MTSSVRDSSLHVKHLSAFPNNVSGANNENNKNENGNKNENKNKNSDNIAMLSGVESFSLSAEEKAWTSEHPEVEIFHGPYHLLGAREGAFDCIVIGESLLFSSSPSSSSSSSSSPRDLAFAASLRALKQGGTLWARVPDHISDEEIKTMCLLGGFVNESLQREPLQQLSESPKVNNRNRTGIVVLKAMKPEWSQAAALPLRKRAKKSQTGGKGYQQNKNNNSISIVDENENENENEKEKEKENQRDRNGNRNDKDYEIENKIETKSEHGSKSKNTWKMMATDLNDDGYDFVNEDSLLDEEMEKAQSASTTASDCGPPQAGTKKRACKNCSCGLKDMETGKAPISDEQLKADVSGCGACSKGDAFRCGSCPYLGLPSFTPGTKPDVKVNSDGSKMLLDLANEEF